MNKKCIALTKEEHNECISLFRNGFALDGDSMTKLCKPVLAYV